MPLALIVRMTASVVPSKSCGCQLETVHPIIILALQRLLLRRRAISEPNVGDHAKTRCTVWNYGTAELRPRGRTWLRLTGDLRSTCGEPWLTKKTAGEHRSRHERFDHVNGAGPVHDARRRLRLTTKHVRRKRGIEFYSCAVGWSWVLVTGRVAAIAQLDWDAWHGALQGEWSGQASQLAEERDVATPESGSPDG